MCLELQNKSLIADIICLPIIFIYLGFKNQNQISKTELSIKLLHLILFSILNTACFIIPIYKKYHKDFLEK